MRKQWKVFTIGNNQREASERHDAQALGLATFVRSYQFVTTLLMLADILLPLANLSRAFQKKDLDYTLDVIDNH